MPDPSPAAAPTDQQPLSEEDIAELTAAAQYARYYHQPFHLAPEQIQSPFYLAPEQLQSLLAERTRNRARLAELEKSLNPADARRLSACWNACRHFTTDDLERIGLGPYLDVVSGHENDGVRLIAIERVRQVQGGWTLDHDDLHVDHELVRAANCYVLASRAPLCLRPGEEIESSPPSAWPWDPEWWKPDLSDPIPNLVKAGALIAAEIDRLRRAATTP